MASEKYTKNTIWMIADKLTTAGLGFIVFAIVARVLGPDSYGSLAYALALVSLFGVAGHMGLNGIAVREFVEKKSKHVEILVTVATLKLIGVMVAFVLLNSYAVIVNGIDSLEFKICFILSLSLILQPVDVLDYFYQSESQSRYVTVARLLSIVVGAIAKLALLYATYSVLWVATGHLIQLALFALVLICFYARGTWEGAFQRPSVSLMKKMLSEGWMVYLGTFFSIIYLKIDLVMLGEVSGKDEAGVYAVASQVSEAFYFIPAVIAASFFPKIIATRSVSQELYSQTLQGLISFLFYLAVVLSGLIFFTVEFWLVPIFGSAYEHSVDILRIQIWASVFIFMRAVFSKWIIIEKLYFFSLISQGLGALLNVLMNVIFIPVYGAEGAAIATLISYSAASFFSLLFYKKTRFIFYMMLFAPFRKPLP
jgi:O-antigen/teichoic acid export membrane protein